MKENCLKLPKSKYKLFNGIIWRNIVYTFYTITVNLKSPTVRQNCWGKSVLQSKPVVNKKKYYQALCNNVSTMIMSQKK